MICVRRRVWEVKDEKLFVRKEMGVTNGGDNEAATTNDVPNGSINSTSTFFASDRTCQKHFFF